MPTANGEFTAQFTNSRDAEAFRARLAGDPDGFHVEPDSVKLNRKGGCRVTWTVAAFAVPNLHEYELGMAETVGYYGSTFGEPPFGAGRRTATLNGRACPASM
jgi:hypothetical protein